MSTASCERRQEILDTVLSITNYWWDHPELRLGQIIYNIDPAVYDDSYHLPDKHLRTWLEAANEKEKGVQNV